ncbi:MAG: hypothetical protein A2147_04650 [Chloroflexi bacterium RBG_16_57_8]|nr:MAG: hypothetical protein A2147_04650 [Chloroflexi bacterium RBG_16_57_8]
MADLADADRVTSSTLAELAGLSHEEMESVRNAWPGIELIRRREIVRRLVELSEENVELDFDAIFRLCLKDPDSEIRCQAIEGLWENEETSLISRLLDMLSNDSSYQVQAAAANALGRFTLMAEKGTLPPRHLPHIQGELLHTLNDESRTDEVRRRALEALAPLSVPEVTSAIRDAYEAKNPRFRVSAICAMGKNCDPAWLPMLIAELSNEDAEMRFEAAAALGELGEEDAVPHLTDLGGDPDAEVQRAVLESLGKIGGRKAKEYLQSCLSSRNPAIRDTARQALDELRAMDDPMSLQL